MDFKDIDYIALEGGGGKGSVYKGSILALEKLMYKDWMEGNVIKKDEKGKIIEPNEAEKIEFAKAPNKFPSISYPSLFNYYSCDDSTILKIKGISGASAGSITSFALSLGLTSSHIETILKSYPFSEELLSKKALSEGKYRMVGINTSNNFEIVIAEDNKKKLGESGIEIFEYEFTKKHQTWIEKTANSLESLIDPSALVGKIKIAIRHQIIALFFNVIFTGLKNLFKLIRKNVDLIKGKIKEPQLDILIKIFDECDLFMDNTKAANFTNNLISPLKFHHKQALAYFGRKWKLGGFIPANNITPAISNLMWDRGVYAGFEVRDFFSNMILFAISEKTCFIHKVIEHKYQDITQLYIDSLQITVDSEFKVSTKGNIKKIEELIRNMTFKDFNDITGLNLIITVTNSTTSQPLYFSHYFTPDYPVIEAVGASMSFPIAFKPLYNEADVKKCSEALPSFVKSVTLKGSNLQKLIFNRFDYDEGLNTVFKHINDKCNLGFSLNGNLSFRSFLPYLRAVIEKEDFNSANKEMKALCYFYYNAAYKGLLNDGGQTDNLPQRIFALNSDKVKLNDYNVQSLDITNRVLALKLDNAYSREIMDIVDEILKKDKGGKLLEKLTSLSMDNRIVDSNFHFYWLKLIIQKINVKIHSKNVFKDLPENKNIYKKVSKAIFEQYKERTKGHTPWNKQENAIGALLNSIQFGLDQGSIDSLGLNSNIVPLYCYGLDVFTFDLKANDIIELVNYANTKSEETVFEHFGISISQK